MNALSTLSHKKRKLSATGLSLSSSVSKNGNKNKKLELPQVQAGDAKTSDSAGMAIASNFASSVHKVMMDISSNRDLPLEEFHFDTGGSVLVAAADGDKCISTNPGVLRLIKTLLTAENEDQIDKALEDDFTAVAAKLPKGDYGGGCGAGFQVYLKGELVLTCGGGGGGGYTSGLEKALERGGGGGASIFIPGDESAHVGGGHGLANGTVESKHDADHDATLFLDKLEKLRDLLSEAHTCDICVLGGGGGGGGETEILRLRSQGEKTEGRGYGFGFQIGSTSSGRPKRTIKAPNRLTVSSFSNVKDYDKKPSTITKNKNSNDLNLPEHLLKEDWAIKMDEYKGKYASGRS